MNNFSWCSFLPFFEIVSSVSSLSDWCTKFIFLGGRNLRLGPSQGWKGEPFVITLISKCKVCTTYFDFFWTVEMEMDWEKGSGYNTQIPHPLVTKPSCIWRIILFALRMFLFFPDILIIKTKLKITLLNSTEQSSLQRYLLKEYYYFIMKIFAAFLNLLCDSSNNSLQSVSKNLLFAPVNTLKIDHLENK